MSTPTGDPLRDELLSLLTPGNAHMTFEDAVAIFPLEHINTPFPNGTYTPWHLLEHLRITQWDILDFIRNPDYHEIEWPNAYWPPQDQQATREDWDRTIAGFQADLRALQDLVRDPKTDLLATIPHGTGQTVLREILTVADHNAYHVGEFAVMRQTMGTWSGSH